MDSNFAPSRKAALAWSLVGAALCGWMTPLEPSLLEEGYMLHFAQRMLGGEQLYRDLVTFTGPLPFEWLALWFRVFGEEISVARASVALLHGLATGASFDAARRSGLGAPAHAAAVCIAVAPVFGFPLLSLFFYSTFAFHATLLAGWTAVRGIRSPGFAFACGVAIAGVALSKQTVGVVLAPALLAAFAIACPPATRTRRVGTAVGGGLAVTLVTLTAYALRGDLGTLVDALVVLPLSLEPSFGSPYPNLWPPGQASAELLPQLPYYVPQIAHLLGADSDAFATILSTQILFALPILAVLATLARAASVGLSGGAWIHTAVFAALATGLFPRADWGHLVHVLPVALVQLIWTLAKPGSDGPVARRATAAFGLVAGIAAIAIGAQLYAIAGPASLGPRVPQRPVSALLRGPELPRVVEFLRAHTQPGDAIFAARMEPLLYFATETRNPTPFGGVIPGIRELQERAVLEGMQQARFVVMTDLDREIFNYYADELPAVQTALERHFRVAPDFATGASWIRVLERGPDRGETAIDLVATRDAARYWVRTGQGIEQVIRDDPPHFAVQQNRRPLALLLGPGGGGADFDFRLPANARFDAGIGLATISSASGVLPHARPVTLRVSLASLDSDDPRFEPLATARLDEAELGYRWRAFGVDLPGKPGERVRLRLEGVGTGAASARAVWWGSPRIVSGAAP